ncbi:hypothetical protein F4V57_07840 [Acinetobacter qingfengensis]|uniref:Uncharacterized protein n=1 Tax=Acinetobacter qingfengensis TaxID=1262585 RepID=A0A1E7QYY2_9GAMM|nr:hypothetical protein [Acinetobacter qingfengensis]KAA8733133.1 hypothetical protein F4V57_07840 [Acinetobacter qingfengensis]OEY92282.1 hypothetical protein BJI46_05935 [Acinetobacter qingfengensis]
MTNLERQQQLIQFIDQIPQSTILTGSHKARFKMLGLGIFGCVASIFFFYRYAQQQSSLATAIIFAIIAVFFLFLTVKRWNDGNIQLIEFTHQQVNIKNLNRSIPLSSIVAFQYIHDDQDALILTLDQSMSDLALQSKTANLAGAIILVSHQKQPTVRITVPYAFESQGKQLSQTQVEQLLHDYTDVAQANRELIMH